MSRFIIMLLSLCMMVSFIACGDDDNGGSANSTIPSTVSTISTVRSLIKGGQTAFNHKVEGLVIGLGGYKKKVFYLYDGTYALQFYPGKPMDPPAAVGQKVSLTIIAGQVFESAIQVIGVTNWVVKSTGNSVDYTGSPEISIENQGKMITKTLTIGLDPLKKHKSNDWRVELEDTYFRNNTGDHSGTPTGTTLLANTEYTIHGVVDAYGDKKAVAIFKAEKN